jgi:hypothetical protein
MKLYHASKLLKFRGNKVLPLNFFGRSPYNAIFFSEKPENALRWVRNKLAGYALYEVDKESIPSIIQRPPPSWEGDWVSFEPIPVEYFRLVQTYNEEAGEMTSLIKKIQQVGDL